MVTPPVVADTEIPVPAAIEVTPVLLMVVVPPKAGEVFVTPIPVPATTPIVEFCNPVLLVAPEVFKLLAKLAKLSACVILNCSSSIKGLLYQNI